MPTGNPYPEVNLGLIQDPTGSIRASLEAMSRHAKHIGARAAAQTPSEQKPQEPAGDNPAPADHDSHGHGHGQEGHACQKEKTGRCCGGCKRPKS